MIQRQQLVLEEKLNEDADYLIYRGRRATEQVPILIKILNSEYPDRKEIAKLQHEYDILKSLDLDGVIKVIDLEPLGHGQAMLMQDFDGQFLSELITREKLPLADTLRTAISVARSLHALHGQHVVHKAVSPQHILRDKRTGKTKLIGFEIAERLGNEDHRREPSQEVEGTPAYLSPEQTGRADLEIDERSDLYSLGVTLYEMLAGVLPFQSEDPVELLHSHIARIPVPPHARAGDIPVVLSDLVMKLLAKTPRDRYQHADAVAADLEVCLAQWEEKGNIAPFVLAVGDGVDVLSIPQTLYGREAHADALMAAFERVSVGRSELFLVAGGAGLGKSALIQEFSKAAVRLGGQFISGKFDPMNRGVPFDSFCQAFRDLARRLLAEPPLRLAEWKEQILAAVGSSGQLLIDLIPELGLVLGPQPPVVPLGPMETQNRFALLLQDFVRLFCNPSRPLILFLDDLQWADPASLSLLRILLSDSGNRHLLVAGAYRDTEVGEGHPLKAVLEELRKQNVSLSEVALEPLDLPSVRRLLGETLNTSGPRLDSLAAQMFTKTHGNPFFVTQLVVALHSAKLLWFDRPHRSWTWDSAAIAAAPITDDIADFMVDRLRKLAPGTRQVLALAACIGYRFDLSLLALIAERSIAEAAVEVGEASRESLVVAHHAGDHFLPSSAAAGVSGTGGGVVVYRFLHDRVQQAAYALIDMDTKQAVHLGIGRRLRDKLTGESGSEALFEATHHLNAGAARIERSEERMELSRLNLKAGQTAKASTAYAAAAGLFRAGISLLDEASWTDDHELAYALHRERTECDHLCGDFQHAGEGLDHLQLHARSDAQRVDVYGMRVRLYLSQGLFGPGIEAGRKGLALLGEHLPDTPELYEEAFRIESSGIDESLSARPLESLIDAPLVEEPGHDALLKLLGSLGVMAYMGEPKLGLLAMAKHVHLSLTRGQSRFSIWGYAFYGFLVASLEQYVLGFRFTRLAVQLAQKHHAVDVECNAYMQLGSCGPYCEPLRLSLGYLDRARRVGLQTGDHFFGSLAYLYFPIMQFRLGEPLDAVRLEVDRSFAVMQRTKDVMCTVWLTALRQAIDRLQGRHGGRATWDGEPLEEADWVARLAGQFIGLSGFYHVFRLQFAVLHEDYKGAYAELAPIEERLAHILNIHWTTEFPFYASLTLAALYPTATPEEQAHLLETIDRHRRRLAMLTELCPANELHQAKLVDAEVARISGNAADAMKLYDESISLAREHGFPHHEALANELCARFHLANGRDRVARAYMLEARYGYERWGATTKVKQIEENYFDLLFHDTTPREDVAAVMQATQAIAGEIVLDQLLSRFMKIVVANAGAQRGSFILKRGDRLTIDAALVPDPDTVMVGQAEPVEGSSSVPAAAVFYVERTKESLVVNLPREDPRFASDPYIIAHEPKSILCLSLMHRGHLVGIIYLENRILNHAFPPGRVQFLKLMSSQAAVAIENALLYADLEAQVSARTQDLRAANEQLQATNERLQIEMAERERLQQAHARMQEHTIRLQNSMLLELSTPIIPITDHIMVMPIVGTIDERRARQILEVSLHGVQASQPKVVIIDITGVRVVDPDVASTLMRIAGALRLLGTETVVTGIRSAVAQTLIALGINLESIETRTNLKMGIAYALSRTGEARRFR